MQTALFTFVYVAMDDFTAHWCISNHKEVKEKPNSNSALCKDCFMKPLGLVINYT